MSASPATDPEPGARVPSTRPVPAGGEPAPGSGTSAHGRASRWFGALGPLFLGMALVLVAWTIWLTVNLPERHVVRSWDLAWGGFDVILTGMFIATGLALLRRSPWIHACAVATAVLLAVDAWIDVTTAQAGEQLAWAIAQALLIELPLAAFCLYVAFRSERVLWRGRPRDRR